MKKRLLMGLTAILLLLAPVPAARADSGPKPSVVVEFRGLEGETYYATLLSQAASTGPWSAEDDPHDPREDRVWTAFRAYADSDGFRFLGYYADCTESQTFRWGYYPPQTFKLLLYFPEYHRMVAGEEICRRYAFDSRFTADGGALELESVSGADRAAVPITRTYDLTGELLSLLCRMALTVGVELLLALAFRFRAKGQLRVIAAVNLATQLVLNALLNIVQFHGGAFAFVACYALLELLVFLIEGGIYGKTLPRRAPEPQGGRHPWLYALTANAASFAAGILLARWLPGIL